MAEQSREKAIINFFFSLNPNSEVIQVINLGEKIDLCVHMDKLKNMYAGKI